MRGSGFVVNRLLAGEITEEGIGLTRLREVATEVLAGRCVPFLFTYHAAAGREVRARRAQPPM
jgi:hypothetical protein